ncbi:transcriptional regulator [Brevibacillus sp. B_LB10_24]|uniref:transcriptional regulator n=1 Tax=Brevibacillus sp. B_LB10_24 TaxID=3380645 RepID=UPI0038BB06DD
MVIRLAAFGSFHLIKRILQYQETLPQIEIIPYIYSKPEESPQLVKEAADCDVLFFTGPVPYFFAEEEIAQKGLPAVYIPFDEYMFVLSLFHIRYHLDQHSMRLSIDLPNADHAIKVFEELNIDPAPVYVCDYRLGMHGEERGFDTNELVKFHFDLWQSGKIDIVLTSIQAVHLELQKLGVNSFRMLFPEKNIKYALEDAMARGELMISKSSQICVGFVSIDQFENDSKSGLDYADKEVILKLHQLLLEFGKSINASIQYLGQNQFIIYGTRGSINHITNHSSEMPILSEIKTKLGITVSMGFGYGLTANEAEQNAQIALFHARKSSGSAYIVTEKKVVIGPLQDEPQSFSLRSDDQKLLAISEKTGISVATISKISEFYKLKRFASFTANELADYLQVGRRSGERTIKKLLEENYAQVTGEEQPYQKGRPRSLYKLTF